MQPSERDTPKEREREAKEENKQGVSAPEPTRSFRRRKEVAEKEESNDRKTDKH